MFGRCRFSAGLLICHIVKSLSQTPQKKRKGKIYTLVLYIIIYIILTIILFMKIVILEGFNVMLYEFKVCSPLKAFNITV